MPAGMLTVLGARRTSSRPEGSRRRGGAVKAALALTLIATGCSAEGAPHPTSSPDDGPKTAAEGCPPSSEWDPESGDSAPHDPPAGTCEPGPDEGSDLLVLDEASLTRGAGRDVTIEVEVTNTGDLSQSMVLPDSIDPRVDDVDGVRRLSFLRVNMTLDKPPEVGVPPEPRVNIENPGWPSSIAVAGGETLTYTETVQLDGELLAEQMLICAEVLPEAHPDAPNAQRETGDISPLVQRGFEGDLEPVPLICSDVVEVG